MMPLCHAFIILVQSFNFQNILRDEVGENHTNTSNPGNSKIIKDSTVNHSVKTRAKKVTLPRCIKRFKPYSICDTQPRTSMLSLSYDSNSNSSDAKNISSDHGKNLMMSSNQIQSNFLNEIFENSPTFIFAPQHQSKDSSEQIYTINDELDTNHLDTQNEVILTSANGNESILIENEHAIGAVDKIIQNKRKMKAEDGRRKKESSCNLSHSENLNISYTSSFMKSPEIEDFSNGISENNFTGKPLDPIKGSTEQLHNAMCDLNGLKICEEKILNYSLENKAFYSIFCTDFDDLKEVTEYAKNICKTWIAREEFIDDSENNKIIFANLLRLILDIRRSINFFETTIDRKISTEPVEILTSEHKMLKDGIRKHKNLIKKLKLLGADKILGSENPEYNSIIARTMRIVKFIYQEENSSNFENFKISIEKSFCLASLSVFEEFIILCIYNSDRYLKILKVNLKTKQHIEINKYIKTEEANNLKRLGFGYGSKYSIIKSSSTGKLFILKSHPLRISEKRSVVKTIFEILVVDKDFKKLASIQVGTIDLKNNSVRPAIFDFVIHNDIVYALDMESKCIKVFNDLLILLNTIPIPESLVYEHDVQLAVSNKFIIISTGKTIFYMKNDYQVTECKRLDLDEFLLNVAFYDEEHIVLRFKCCSYLLKIEENSVTLNVRYLPALDQLKYLTLTNFMIKDNFLYSICVKTNQIFKINLILNAAIKVI